MKQILLSLLLLFTAHPCHLQDLYILKQVDSIPVHFRYATDIVVNATTIRHQLKKLQTIRDGNIVVNAYTDSVGTIEYNTELGAKRLAVALEKVKQYAHAALPVTANNCHEDRNNQPLGINDTLYRRVDILVYEQQLNIEYGKPYPLPINFEGNQHVLLPKSKLVINKITTVLEAHPKLNVKLHGHTSGRGRDYELSLNRAIAVKNYMVERGVDEKRITCKGFDNTQKLYHEEPWENNPLNRRVEIIFVE